MNKPVEYYVAVLSAMAFVILQHKDKPWWSRVVISAISGGVGYSLAPDFANWTGRSETMGAVILTAFGYIALDLIGSLLADRRLVKDIVKRRLGGDQT